VEKQTPLAHHEDPVLTTTGIVTKLDKAKDIFNRIKNTVKPKPPKNGTNTTDGGSDYYNFGDNGKFDDEKFKEYMKKMNITFDGNKFNKAGEDGDQGEDNTEKAQDGDETKIPDSEEPQGEEKTEQAEQTTKEDQQENSKDKKKDIDVDL